MTAAAGSVFMAASVIAVLLLVSALSMPRHIVTARVQPGEAREPVAEVG